jgi:hypothetical protein
VQEIQSMMYTFGDVKSALAETAEMIEDILHGQLVDIVPGATDGTGSTDRLSV